MKLRLTFKTTTNWLGALGLALAATAAPSLSLAAPATVAGVAMPADFPAGEAADTHWGVRVPDPYRALENPRDPAVQQWLRSHADATTQVFAKIPGRDALLQRIQAIDAGAAGSASSLQRSEDGRLFFLRRNPGEQQAKLIVRESVTADASRERVLIDPDQLSREAGRPVALLGYAASPDGKKLAYALQAGGGEIGALRVVEVDGGRLLAGPIDRIRGLALIWLPDSSGFFYTRLREGFDQLPATERFQNTVTSLHTLGGSDVPVFSADRFPELGLPPIASALVFQLPGTEWAGALVSLGVNRNQVVLMSDLASVRRGQPAWRKVVDVADQVHEAVSAPGALFLRSAKDAPRFQVLRLPLPDPRSAPTPAEALATMSMARAEPWVPQTEGVINDLVSTRDGLYVARRQGVNTQLFKMAHGSRTLRPVALPLQGHVSVRSSDIGLPGLVVQVSSWTRAAADFALDAEGRSTRLQLAQPGAFDAPEGISSRELMVKSHDGVEVPVSILSRRDVRFDGNNPTVLYGYGAYGVVESPGFSPRMLAFLERGGVYVYAHVRGGGVFGQGWHAAGHKTTKPNTWRDGIAVAQWLIAQGWTKPEKLTVYGGSAGGIFVGRAATERPDLFAAAISSVGVLDTVRSETRANGVANVPEYGTVAKEDEFQALLRMSSYHALTPGTRYPAFLLLHGVNDIRVDVWQSAKFAARLSALESQQKPVLMRLDYEAGHGSGSSRTQQQERTADLWAFVLWQTGVAEFQPAAR
jgi:prolyl oligopeptidase